MRSAIRLLMMLILFATTVGNLWAPDRCSGWRTDVVCGMICKNYWDILGMSYCTPTGADADSGCVQLTSGCGSLGTVDCCGADGGGGGSF